LEFLVMSGMELPLALMITIPEPWENDNYMPRHKRDFYRYYATFTSNIFTHHNTRSTLRRIEIIAIKIIIINIS